MLVPAPGRGVVAGLPDARENSIKQAIFVCMSLFVDAFRLSLCGNAQLQLSYKEGTRDQTVTLVLEWSWNDRVVLDYGAAAAGNCNG